MDKSPWNDGSPAKSGKQWFHTGTNDTNTVNQPRSKTKPTQVPETGHPGNPQPNKGHPVHSGAFPPTHLNQVFGRFEQPEQRSQPPRKSKAPQPGPPSSPPPSPNVFFHTRNHLGGVRSPTAPLRAFASLRDREVTELRREIREMHEKLVERQHQET